MSDPDWRSRLRAELEESLCRDPAVEFAVVFGSQVTGDTRPASDFDLAIKFVDECSSHERFQKRCFLSGDLQRDDAPFIDVSDIEALPIAVAHDAVNGEFVCGDERALQRFRATVVDEFEARRDDIRREQRDAIDRIAEGGLRG